MVHVRQGEILLASGRGYAATPFVLADLKTYPILGKGSLNLGNTRNSSTNVAGHVVWFNIYQRFGVIGVIYLLAIKIKKI